MKSNNTKKIVITVIIVLLLGVTGYGYYYSDVPETNYLTILHTNDVHGRLEPFMYSKDSGKVGGLARRAALIKTIEASNRNVITLDAGDFAQGSLFFNVFNGVPDARLMSEAGYDAGTLGNHEFDKGLAVTKEIVKHVKYPIVSANIRFTRDNELQRMVRPYIIKRHNGMNIAIIGLVPEDLPVLSSAKEIEVYDTVETVKNIVKKIDSQADLIVVLSHIGIKEDIELAKSVPEVDVIVGGHSHTLLRTPELFHPNGDRTLVLQAGEFGRYLGRLDIKFRDKKVQDYYYELIPVNEGIKPDETVKYEIALLAEGLADYKNQKIGQLAVPLGVDGKNIRSKLLPEGSLVTSAIKSRFPDVDIVLQNSGGIRPYRYIGPYAITVADIMELFPFENTVVTLELSGKDLKSVLETSSRGLPESDNGGFLQSLGLEYTIDLDAPAQLLSEDGTEMLSEGERVSDIKINGKPLEEDKYYKIAINNYMFEGGNGFSQFKNAVNTIKTGVKIQEIIINHIEANSPVAPEVKDRINFRREQK